MAYCRSCGTQISDDSVPCPACGASQNTTPPPPPATAFATRAEVVYAGFFRRWLALWVDGLILGIPLGIVAVIAAIGLGIGSHGKPDDAANLVGVLFEAVFYPLYWIAAALYFSLQESSRHQATLGKRLLGIKVTDLAGNRLTFGHAIGRWFAAALSYLTLYIGFLVAAFTAKKQALHDFVAGTLVVDQHAFTDHPELQKKGLHGCLIAIVVAVFVMVPVIAILAAIALPAYQDYIIRAQVATGMLHASEIEPVVGEYLAQTSECATNGVGGIKQPGEYVEPYVQSIDTGRMNNTGKCGIQITFGNKANAKLTGKRIWLELDSGSNTWQCSSEIENRYLPQTCRQ